MSFRIERDKLIEPLQLVMGVVEKRQTLPILSHMLCEVSNSLLTLTGSDHEVEITASCEVEGDQDLELEFTLPARKFFDICRNLPSKSVISVELDNQVVQVQSDRFRSQLVGLPGHDFPRVSFEATQLEVEIPAKQVKDLIDQVAFAMANQDVRYFFNGMLLEFSAERLRAVATNGQRLALADHEISASVFQAIVPKKAVSEILRVTKGEGEVSLQLNRNHLRLVHGENRLTTKLIDAVYPDYNRAIPENTDKQVRVNRIDLKSALARISILSNELYRNVRLSLEPGLMRLNANNPLQEEAEEVLEILYEDGSIEIGFNVSYLADVLSVLSSDEVELSFSDASSPMLIKDPDNINAMYVVSPMVL